MLIYWLLILAGLVVLIGGAEALVRGAGGIALIAKISPSVVALTVVAAGTSMPEMVVSAGAALGGNPGLALGEQRGVKSVEYRTGSGNHRNYPAVAYRAEHNEVRMARDDAGDT